MTNLKKLNVFNNQLKELKYIENLPNIKELSINKNFALEKLENIFHLNELQEINLGRTSITDI